MNFRRFPTSEGYCLINLDLVAMLRPHPDNDGCIVSLMNGTDIVFVDSVEDVYQMMSAESQEKDLFKTDWN